MKIVKTERMYREGYNISCHKYKEEYFIYTLIYNGAEFDFITNGAEGAMELVNIGKKLKSLQDGFTKKIVFRLIIIDNIVTPIFDVGYRKFILKENGMFEAMNPTHVTSLDSRLLLVTNRFKDIRLFTKYGNIFNSKFEVIKPTEEERIYQESFVRERKLINLFVNINTDVKLCSLYSYLVKRNLVKEIKVQDSTRNSDNNNIITFFEKQGGILDYDIVDNKYANAHKFKNVKELTEFLNKGTVDECLDKLSHFFIEKFIFIDDVCYTI